MRIYVRVYIYLKYTNFVVMNTHNWKNTWSLKDRAHKEEENKKTKPRKVPS